MNNLKLLGLNASIEAAKAGESGKGFAVVAHEMNKLSMATKESINKINTILENIINSSLYVSNSIDSCVRSYSDSKDTFKSIRESFGIINNSATVLESDMKKVYDDVHLINSSTQEINQKSFQLHSLSGEISGKTQVVAAVTQQSLAELEEINTYTSNLQTMLTRIERLVKRYHTSVVPVENESKRQLRITFISPLDNEFWHIVRQGAMYAIRELRGKNVVIDYIGIKEDVDAQMKKKAREAIENGVDGIIVPGFDPEMADIIEVAYQKNIPAMVYNFNLQSESKSIAFCGPEFCATSAITVRYMAKALGGIGEIATFSPGVNRFVDNFEKETTSAEVRKFKGMKVVANYQCGDNYELSYKTVKELLKQKPNIRGLIFHGGGLLGAAKAIEELGLTGKVFILSFSFSAEIAEYIKKGVICASITHDPFSQGHDPIIHFYNILVTGKKPESRNIWTRFGVIDKSNVDDML